MKHPTTHTTTTPPFHFVYLLVGTLKQRKTMSELVRSRPFVFYFYIDPIFLFLLFSSPRTPLTPSLGNFRNWPTQLSSSFLTRQHTHCCLGFLPTLSFLKSYHNIYLSSHNTFSSKSILVILKFLVLDFFHLFFSWYNNDNDDVSPSLNRESLPLENHLQASFLCIIIVVVLPAKYTQV